MTLNGCDVSAYQPASPAWGPNRFAFIKATEGVGWESPVWRAQIASGRAAGIGTGYYHFCDGRNTPQAEAQYYWGVIGSTWQAGEPIALDVEGPFFDYVADPVGWTLACAQEFHRLTGVIPVFYSDWSHVKGKWNWQPLVDFNMGLWGAAYNPTGFGDPSPWPTIFVWQNADTNPTGGDSNVLYGDLNTWRAYGTPATIQPANGGNVTPIGDPGMSFGPTDPVFKSKDGNPVSLQDLLDAIDTRAAHIESLVTDFPSFDTDVRGDLSNKGAELDKILSEADPAKIAAAIPANIAQQVIDALAARLAQK